MTRWLPSLGRAGWALIGALALYVAYPNQVVTYPEVIVPAARIIEREPPTGPPTIIQRVTHVYPAPDVRAVAPNAVGADVAAFCRPVVVAVPTNGDTADVAHERVPTPWVIRTLTDRPSWIPFRRDGLTVTAMDGNGDLTALDFRVRPGYSASWGDEISVRYPRGALIREVGEGVLWYGLFRGVEAVVRGR